MRRRSFLADAHTHTHTHTHTQVVGHSGELIDVEFELTPKVRAEEEFFGTRVVETAAHQEVY